MSKASQEDQQMYKHKFLLGIDGGGSKTKFILTNSKKKIIDHTITGPSNISKSMTKAWESIQQGIEDLIKKNQIEINKSSIDIGLGLAGAENNQIKNNFLAMANTYIPYAHKISLESDAHVACLGIHKGKPGAIMIVGTGTQAYQIDENFNSNKVGCWGSPIDDQGGGAWVGLEAIRLTFKCADGRQEPCLLSNLILQKFEYDIAKFCIWANQANTSQYASLTKEVILAATQEDKPAISILKQAAKEVTLTIHSLEKIGNKTPPLPLCLIGGMAPFILPYLPKSITKRLIKRTNPHDVCYGALEII